MPNRANCVSFRGGRKTDFAFDSREKRTRPVAVERCGGGWRRVLFFMASERGQFPTLSPDNKGRNCPRLDSPGQRRFAPVPRAVNVAQVGAGDFIPLHQPQHASFLQVVDDRQGEEIVLDKQSLGSPPGATGSTCSEEEGARTWGDLRRGEAGRDSQQGCPRRSSPPRTWPRRTRSLPALPPDLPGRLIPGGVPGHAIVPGRGTGIGEPSREVLPVSTLRETTISSRNWLLPSALIGLRTDRAPAPVRW